MENMITTESITKTTTKTTTESITESPFSSLLVTDREIVRLIVLQVDNVKDYASLILSCKKVYASLLQSDTENQKNKFTVLEKIHAHRFREEFYVLLPERRVKHGPYKKFNADGICVIKGEYKNRYRHGKWSIVDPEGRSCLRHYIKGEITGIELMWDTDGQLCQENNYVNGQLHGEMKEYEFGKLCCIQVWNHGNLIRGRSISC